MMRTAAVLSLPPWPIAFGNGKRAAALLEDVVARHPTSLAGNLYGGLRLIEHGQHATAAAHLQIASAATLGCDCPNWTGWLQRQAKEALAALR